MGLEDGAAGNFQHRSGGAVHQRVVHRAAGGARDRDQHGRAGPGDGQHLCGAAVAKREVRRGLSERIRAGAGGGEASGKVFSVLQSGASPSGLELSDAGGDLLRKTERPSMRQKRGGAGGRARSGSSFIGQPGAKFPCEEATMRMKKEKRTKKERTGGLWKLTPRMKSAKDGDSHRGLKKAPPTHLGLFTS